MKNKYKIGDKVKLTHQCLEWHVSHLSWSYGRLRSNDRAYLENQKEIDVSDLPSVYMYVDAYLNKKSIKGTVIDFGLFDDETKAKNLHVKLTHKTPIGTLVESGYFSINDVEKL